MVTEACSLFRYRIVAITAAFWVGDAGSIPVLHNFIVLFLTDFYSTGGFPSWIIVQVFYCSPFCNSGYSAVLFFVHEVALLEKSRCQNESLPVLVPAICQNCVAGWRLILAAAILTIIAVPLLHDECVSPSPDGYFFACSQARYCELFSYPRHVRCTSKTTEPFRGGAYGMVGVTFSVGCSSRGEALPLKGNVTMFGIFKKKTCKAIVEGNRLI